MTPEELRTSDKYAVIRSLLDGTMPFHEVMAAFDIHMCVQDTGPGLWGMVYRCAHGHYHIVISDALTYEQQQRVLLHELCHVIEHMPKAGYTIKANEQYSKIEQQADMMVREVAAGMK